MARDLRIGSFPVHTMCTLTDLEIEHVAINALFVLTRRGRKLHWLR